MFSIDGKKSTRDTNVFLLTVRLGGISLDLEPLFIYSQAEFSI
jgi:hypothetical protein